MIDETDKLILDILKRNSKLPLKDIGELVHLTPQAVSNRITHLQHIGVITQFTICTNNELLGKTLIAYITIFMKTLKHSQLIQYIHENPLITEAHKISGDGCYILKLVCSDLEEINSVLDAISEYGTYQLNLSTSTLKG